MRRPQRMRARSTLAPQFGVTVNEGHQGEQFSDEAKTGLVRKAFELRGPSRRGSEKNFNTFLRGEQAVMAKVETILEEIKGFDAS